jgi:hypothetical protein
MSIYGKDYRVKTETTYPYQSGPSVEVAMLIHPNGEDLAEIPIGPVSGRQIAEFIAEVLNSLADIPGSQP